MNIDPYEIDAQARNSNAKRERTAKNKEVQKTQLPRTRLKADFNEFKSLTPKHLEHISDISYTQPVLSLYINLSPDRLQRQKDVFLTVFNSLKHTALQENQSYIQSLPREQQQNIDEDLWLIHSYLQNDFEVDGAKSIALFKSGDKLQRVYKLSIHSDDYLGIDPDPYTLPLMVSLDEQRQALVVQLSTNSANFYKYHSGNIYHLDDIKSQVPDLSLDISRPNKVQRHNYDHLNRHLKEACAVLTELSNKHDLSDIVLIGDERVVTIFQESCLSQDKQNQVIAVLPNIPGSKEGELAEQVWQRLQQEEVAEEGYYLDMIQREDGRDGIVKGIDEVVSAQNRHLVRSLLVDKQLKRSGYYCQYDQYISTSEAICPLCERQMVAIDNVVEKLIELASQYQIDYKIIRERTDELEKYGGIAATMYDFQ